MDTVVKKLNEIADQIAGSDVEDAKTVAEGLIAIGNAFGGEGEQTESIVKALDYIKANVSGGGDYTTATLSFDLTAPEGVTMEIEYIEANVGVVSDLGYFYKGNLGQTFNEPMEVLLYKGEATIKDIVFIDDEENYYQFGEAPTFEGNIEAVGSNVVLKGDAKIICHNLIPTN